MNSALIYSSSITNQKKWMQWGAVLLLIYALLVAVNMIGAGFKIASDGHAKELFAFASNPITALVIGIVATSLIQSSSTVSSIIVGLVAGGLPIEVAIPMIMGSNIGTTITNTIVSLGHIRNKEEFERAFSAATIHDFFNLLSVLIFLPLEIMFSLLQKIGVFLSSLLVESASMSIGGFDFLKAVVSPPLGAFKELLQSSGFSDMLTGSILIIVGIGLIFFVISFIGKILKVLMVGKAKEILHAAIGKGAVSGIATGAGVTVLVQSSSTTTSLIIPLAGSGLFSLSQIYPFTLGANIGTTITALLAATAVEGPLAIFALQIALIHFAYNFLGVLIIYTVPFLREMPIIAAKKLASLATKRKLYVLFYVLGTFFLLPALLIAVTN